MLKQYSSAKNPNIGANIAKDILIIKLLMDSIVARLLDVVFIVIALRSIGVTTPLNR